MRRLIFGTIIGSLTVAAAAATAIYYFERPNVLRVAVPHDSDDQAIMAAAALDFAGDHEGIRLKLIAVDGLAESSRVLEEGRADLAIVRSDIAMPPNGQTVLIMRRNIAVLFAPAQSGLRAIDDLRGHKIGILQSVPAGKADNQLLLDTALAQYDVPPASVKRVSLSVGEACAGDRAQGNRRGFCGRRARFGRIDGGGRRGCHGRSWAARLSSDRGGKSDRTTFAAFRGGRGDARRFWRCAAKTSGGVRHAWGEHKACGTQHSQQRNGW